MPKSNVHVHGWEHRDLHNVYGYYVHKATFEGLQQRSEGHLRPFVLSRSFFAGSQRYGAVWTGDNTADWGHLRMSVPMLLSLSVSGLPFVGADVGGFFNDPSGELMTRWYQLGAFYPFFRNHAHQDTKHRELWTFESVYAQRMRHAIVRRYQLMPYVYTVFRDASQSGDPVMRPLWWHFHTDTENDSDSDVMTRDDAFMFGPGLLVFGVYTADTSQMEVSLPGTRGPTLWWDVHTTAADTGPFDCGSSVLVECEYSIPVFQKGGSIICERQRVRRSSALMQQDPFTIIVALNAQNESEGSLYLDDAETAQYVRGVYTRVEFEWKQCVLRNVIAHNVYAVSNGRVERVVVYTPSTVVHKSALRVHVNIGQSHVVLPQSCVGVSASGHRMDMKMCGCEELRVDEPFEIHFHSDRDGFCFDAF